MLLKNLNKPKGIAVGIKVYRFSRGDKYSCDVTINEGTVIFSNIVYPSNTTDEVKQKLLDDAEREAMKMYDDEEQSLWEKRMYD